MRKSSTGSRFNFSETRSQIRAASFSCTPMAAANVRYFATSDDAADAAVELVRTGDLVLVKGSRGVKTDRVVGRLKAERS